MSNSLANRCRVVTAFAVLMTIVIVFFSIYFKTDLIVKTSHKNSRKETSDSSPLPSRILSPSEFLQVGPIMATRVESLSTEFDSKHGQEYQQVFPSDAVAFTLFQSIPPPLIGRDVKTDWANLETLSFNECMEYCSQTALCRSFSYDRHRENLDPSISMLIGALKPPPCLLFAFRSCWREDLQLPDSALNPMVSGKIYEKGDQAKMAAPHEFIPFMNTRIIPKAPNAKMMKAAKSRRISLLQEPGLLDVNNVIMTSGLQCAQECNHRIFPDGRRCRSFEVKLQWIPVNGDIEERLLCQFHTESLLDSVNSAMLDVTALRSGLQSNGHMLLHFSALMKAAHQLRDRVCYHSQNK